MRVVLITLLTATALLSACDPQRIEKLEEGLATESDVRKQFGDAPQIIEHADGSKTMAYPRQPQGWTNYEIVIGSDGKMRSLRQLLTPANFAKVQPGMAQDEVRKLLGKHAKTLSYAMKPTEEVWQWRFMSGQDKKVFEVTFDRDHSVIVTHTADDEKASLPGG